MRSSDELVRYWETRRPQECSAGRIDARKDIEQGVVKIKVAADVLLIRPESRQCWVSLADKGVDCEVYGDVGAPHPGYVATYNQEMERELERHYDQDTVHAVRQLLCPEETDGA